MINYKKLYYFYSVAKYGGVTRASEQLHITPQTISGQVSDLEDYLGAELFYRKGKRMELTAYGKLAYSYSEEIFQIGRELESLIKGKKDQADITIKVGISAVVPKSIAHRILLPIQKMQGDIRLVCHEEKLNNLFAELAIHKIDLIIADRPMPNYIHVKAYSHLLGASKTAFFGIPELAEKYEENFPASLSSAPVLLPGEDSAIRLKLEGWLAEKGINPTIKGEYDDTALMKVFAERGFGIFPAPEVIAEEIFKQHGVIKIGVIDDILLKYYAISVERKLSQPSVVAITKAARSSLWQSD